MNIEKKLFGLDKEGKEIFKYCVEVDEDFSCVFGEIGAAVMGINVKDREGTNRDVVLGLDSVKDYFRNWPAFGAVIGRCANRVDKAAFVLDGVEYKLYDNMNGCCLHSGYSYQYRKFESESFISGDEAHIIFKLFSEDGDQGFPGNLDLCVEYVAKHNELSVKYHGLSDKNTVLNLTNHCYFNLNGHGCGKIFNHYLTIYSDKVTQVDKNLMPTGKIIDVDGTPFDFKNRRKIGDKLKDSFKPIAPKNEYDINYVLGHEQGVFKKAATLESEDSGIGMNVYTDMPDMQFYTANAIGMKGKEGKKYSKNGATCFETQYAPNAINIPDFIQPTIKAGEKFESVTKFEFYNF